MFTDIAGFTAIMGKDESKALLLLEQNRKIQLPCIEKYNGKFLKELGDGTLVQFNSAYDAVLCAKEIQRQAKQDLDASLRIGIHLGDITVEEGDVFGDGVNVASRIQTIADPGGIYVSESIANAIRNQPNLEIKRLGEAQLKNVNYPVRVYAVQGEGLPKPAFTSPKLKKRRKAFALYAFLFIAAIASWFIIRNMSSEKLQTIRSLAVLPITNMTGSDENQYLVDGIHDALITHISHIKSLRVISRHTTNRYAQTKKSSVEIANELNVDAILESSILRADDSIQLNVQLIQVKPEEGHLWAAIFNQSFGQVFGMISNLTQQISKSIKAVLSPGEKDLVLVKNEIDPSIYKKYIRGKLFLQQYTPDGFQNGIQYLNEVIKDDPAFAPAYATMAIGYGDLAHLPSAPQEAFPRAKAMAKRALELDASLVEANTAMAEVCLYHDWQFTNAEKYFKAALDIDSSFAPALSNYGWYLDLVDKKNEAEYYLRKAADLDPLAPIYRAWLAWWYWVQKRYEEGITEAKKVLEFSPDFRVANYVLGGIYADIGKYDEAIDLSAKAANVSPNFSSGLVIAYIKAGKLKDANAYLEKMDKTPFNAFSLFQIYTELGDKDEAIKWLKVVYEIRHIFTPWVPGFFVNERDDLQNDPRFKSLIKPITDSIQAAKK